MRIVREFFWHSIYCVVFGIFIYFINKYFRLLLHVRHYAYKHEPVRDGSPWQGRRRVSKQSHMMSRIEKVPCCGSTLNRHSI